MTEPDAPIPLPPLVTLGNPRLAQPSVPLDPAVIASPEFQERLDLLHRVMLYHIGIGIAAPQIGWYERIFIMSVTVADGAVDGGTDADGNGDGDAAEETASELQIWINPEIVTASPEHCWAWEGCLSVPGLRGWIRRPAAVAVRGRNEQGEAVSREFTGWNARVFQHEFDHLEGVLFPYRAQDPRHIVTLQELDDREDWPEDWPAPHARDTPTGEVRME